DDSSPPRHDDTSIPDTRLEPRSDKESLEVEINKEKEVEIVDKEVEVTTDIIPVNVVKDEEQITDEVYELKRREKGKTKFMPRKSFDTLATNLHDVLMEMLPLLVKEKVTEQVKKEVPAQVRDQVPVYLAEGLILERKMTKEETERIISRAILQECGRIYMLGHILHVHPAQVQLSFVPELKYQLYLAMKADPLLQQQDISIWLAFKMKFEKTQVTQTACRSFAVCPRDQDDPHDDAHPEGENSAKRQKTSEYEAYVSGESSSGQLKKMADEMLRQRCTSGDEHPYHIDQMKNFLQSDIVWESRKEILVPPHPRKITPLVQSCQRDPKAPALSLINQDLLYLKKGNSGPEKMIAMVSISVHQELSNMGKSQ
ncbi:hypothetical protein Tco_0337519, partial [Tanacetum coccineum]